MPFNRRPGGAASRKVSCTAGEVHEQLHGMQELQTVLTQLQAGLYLQTNPNRVAVTNDTALFSFMPALRRGAGSASKTGGGVRMCFSLYS